MFNINLEIMNRIKCFVALVIALNFGLTSAMNLQDAVKLGKVKLTLFSNGKSVENGILTARIHNTSLERLELKIPVGTHLISEDDGRQNLILVQEELFTLAPNVKKSLDLKGMCIQASNQSPGSEVAYKLGDVLQGDLLECAKMINDKKVVNACGQEAIWAFSDNHDVG